MWHPNLFHSKWVRLSEGVAFTRLMRTQNDLLADFQNRRLADEGSTYGCELLAITKVL